MAARTGAGWSAPATRPALIAGVGTVYLELFEAATGAGRGGRAGRQRHRRGRRRSGRRALAPGCGVIAVQSAASPAAHDSWRAGRGASSGPTGPRSRGWPPAAVSSCRRGSCASGWPTSAGPTTQIGAAQRMLASHAHTLAEGAGAAALAAVLAGPDGSPDSRSRSCAPGATRRRPNWPTWPDPKCSGARTLTEDAGAEANYQAWKRVRRRRANSTPPTPAMTSTRPAAE